MTPEKTELVRAEDFDFADEFRRRLSTIPSIYGKNSVLEGKIYRGIGVIRLKHIVPAILFIRDREALEIWIENPDRIDRVYPHADIEDGLKSRFPELQGSISKFGMTSAVVLEDWEDHTYLSVQDWIGRMIRTKVAEGSDYMDVPETNIDTLEDLVKRYGLHKIVSRVPKQATTKDGTIHWSREEDVLSPDIVGQYRENSFLRGFQERFDMTPRQFMRFRVLVGGAKRAGQPLNYDKLAAEIVSEEG